MNDISETGTIRVTQVIKGLGPGGAERLLVNQVKTSTAADIRYRVITLLPHKDHLVSELGDLGVPVECIGSNRMWPIRLAGEVRKDTDIVHAHSPVVASVVRLLGGLRLLDVPVVTTEHNRWPRHHRVTRAANRATIGFDSATIAVSDDVRRSISRRARGGVTVLQHGIPSGATSARDGASRKTTRAELRVDDSAVVIGIVANFRREKGYDIFVRAAAEAISSARRTGPLGTASDAAPTLHFVVVGQGPGEADVRRAVCDAGIASHVTITGYRSDTLSVMRAFDVFTLTSRHEGLPVALMEAMSVGLPVVATRAGGIPEVITDDVEGRLVDVDDTVAVARAWVELAADEGLRRRMGQAAASAACRFDAAVSTATIESLYRELLDHRR